MHDDDTPINPEPEEPESYWTEADWERFMLENEKLMDRYEEVRKQNPDRAWDCWGQDTAIARDNGLRPHGDADFGRV